MLNFIDRDGTIIKDVHHFDKEVDTKDFKFKDFTGYGNPGEWE